MIRSKNLSSLVDFSIIFASIASEWGMFLKVSVSGILIYASPLDGILIHHLPVKAYHRCICLSNAVADQHGSVNPSVQ
jgi:hypothetical protein